MTSTPEFACGDVEVFLEGDSLILAKSVVSALELGQLQNSHDAQWSFIVCELIITSAKHGKGTIIVRFDRTLLIII